MLWSDLGTHGLDPRGRGMRNLLLPFFFLLSLGACGFRPLYGEGGATKEDRRILQELPRVFIESLPDRHGQLLRNALMDRLQAKGAADAAYRLQIQLTPQERELLIAKDATAKRGKLVLIADWKLFDISNDAMIASGQAQSSASYNILDAQYATLAARENAYARGVEPLADAVLRDLARAFAKRATGANPAPKRAP